MGLVEAETARTRGFFDENQRSFWFPAYKEGTGCRWVRVTKEGAVFTDLDTLDTTHMTEIEGLPWD